MTKVEALIEAVLAPHSLKLAVRDIGSAPFSISVDAFNIGSMKLFPVVIQYFNKDKGICTSLLDFLEDADETSEVIVKNLRSCLQNASLVQNKIVAYGERDFEENESGFVHLKQMLDLPNLVPTHCSTQIVHNTAKHGLRMLSYHVECLVLKVFSEVFALDENNGELKEFFDFMKTDYTEILRQVPKSFLALFTAIEKLLKNWPALKSYFVSKGEEDVNCTVWAFLSEHKDIASNDETITLPELYIYFVHNLMSQFTSTIKVLESNYLQVTELYATFNKLRREIQNRQEKGFYGYKVMQLLKKLHPNEQNTLIGDAQQTYMHMLRYLEKRFDFSENSFYKLCAPLSLDRPLELDKRCTLMTNLDIQVDVDELFTEVSVLNDALPILKGSIINAESEQEQQQHERHRQTGSSEVWVEFFKCCEAPNLLRIVQHVFAVPASNTFVERIVSVMKNLWADERNRLQTDLVKAELFVHFNYKMTCDEFAGFLQTGAAKELMAAAANCEMF
ncbi:uncharacterized protein LOC142009044 [Carettochelys insculpta]|uniref:uncharacterized protein LOC142009044 n=1 Tax=Carettochelys insculpta TaxID=44489 RepID=UPI003EC03CF9